jgi:hypothetical protein
VVVATVRKVAAKAPKAAAEPYSNHSPAPHGGPNPLCGLGILSSPQTRISAAGSSSHTLSRASGCILQRGSIFFRNSMSNLFLRGDDGLATKTEYERSRAKNRRRFVVANWHGRNLQQRRFLNVGGMEGWAYLLAIRTFSERERYVGFVMGDRQPEKAQKSYS